MNLFDLVGALVAVLPTEEIQDELKEVADRLIDKAENLIEKTPTKLDDVILLPLISTGRKIIGVPDGES